MDSSTDVVQKDKSLRKNSPSDGLLVALSIGFQLLLGLFLGHAYDMRIFMATGFLAATGQNPYIPQDLSLAFHDKTFQAITSIGYPPPWPLVAGLIYLLTYRMNQNLLLYNLALKIPIIASNVCLAYLVANILKKLKVEEKKIHIAWLFMLFNPYILYVSAAWGQIDSLVALCTLLSLLLLSEGRLKSSAILLALAISLKPTALALIPVAFVFLPGKPFRLLFRYFATLLIASLLLWVGPFAIFRWDPTIILQHWNFQFSVGGGLSYMTFLELYTDSYQLPGWWWLLGMLWLPALCVAVLILKPGDAGLLELLKKSAVLVMVFFLFRAWVSETNLLLLLPIIVILATAGELDPRILTAFWVLPLIFSFFNTTTFQLLFPSMPALMDRLLQLSEVYRTERLVIRITVVIPWLILAGWLVIRLLKQPRRVGEIPALQEN